jgi:hypothetical protein
MRKLIITLFAIATLIAGAIAYFLATTPDTSAGVRFPLSPAHRALIAMVPAEAESLSLIPTAAGLDAKLRANPITAAPLEEWEEKHLTPSPWMIGKGDLVAWREGKRTRYLVRLDPVRALVVRMVLMFRGDSSGTLLLDPPDGEKLPADELARIAALADTLPAGDALVVQRGSHRAFPPIGRPAVTSVQITATDVVMTSRANVEADAEPPGDVKALMPRDAILTFAFSAPPRAIGDLNRLFGSKVSTLLEDGGQVTLYDVDAGKLLPRPIGVIAVPADDARRATLDGFLQNVAPAEIVGVRARSGERHDPGNSQLVVSFDSSLDRYIKDAVDAGSWPAARWAVRMDPKRIVPVVKALDGSYGLRLATPHLYQSVKDLEHWIGALEAAGRIDAVDSVKEGSEQLEVRIAK